MQRANASMVHYTHVIFSSGMALKWGCVPWMESSYTESVCNACVTNSTENHCSPFITLYLLHILFGFHVNSPNMNRSCCSQLWDRDALAEIVLVSFG